MAVMPEQSARPEDAPRTECGTASVPVRLPPLQGLSPAAAAGSGPQPAVQSQQSCCLLHLTQPFGLSYRLVSRLQHRELAALGSTRTHVFPGPVLLDFPRTSTKARALRSGAMVAGSVICPASSTITTSKTCRSSTGEFMPSAVAPTCGRWQQSKMMPT